MLYSTFTDVLNTGQAPYPGLDFETYSEAGYTFDSKGKRKGKGLKSVGMAVYAEHPTTEILFLSYQLEPAGTIYSWMPGNAPPRELLHYISAGNILSAANSMFEFLIWHHVCMCRSGWPALPIHQLRDTLAAAQRWSLPGKLEDVAQLLNVTKKDPIGKRLIDLLSKPQSATKKNPNKRRDREAFAVEYWQMLGYNRKDVQVESEVSASVPKLSPYEEQLWLLDQTINARGVYIDIPACKNAKICIDRTFAKLETELRDITQQRIQSVGQTAKTVTWLNDSGCNIYDLTKESVENALNQDIPDSTRRVLEIRQLLGSASVKKIHALLLTTSCDNRLRNLFRYCGADRTGRWAGKGVQPHNLPRSGPSLSDKKWSYKLYNEAFADIATLDINYIIRKWGDPLKLIAGCLRGMFMAPPGCEFISSDFSAIEAVVLAALAKEEWRLEVFRTHGKIYEASASMITGTPINDITKDQRMLGKVAELASGYQGGAGAWEAFGAGAFMSLDDMGVNVRQWRSKSPNIVNFWYGIERAAIAAIKSPGTEYAYNGIMFCMAKGVLYCRLPSGRFLNYHKAHLRLDVTPWGKEVDKIFFEGWNSNPNFGKLGWITTSTYGGKLVENIVQATSRDILGDAMLRIEAAGYPIVMHIHDEIVSEVITGFGSIEEYEQIMANSPTWCADWPIRAEGGWRGMRYRK